MKGKIKQIKRSEWYVGNQAYQHSHDLHDIRMTCLYAETYEGHQVLIDEKDVLNYFGRQRFSDNLLAGLNSLLRNKLIDYQKNLNFNLFCNDNVCFRIFAWSATLSTSLS